MQGERFGGVFKWVAASVLLSALFSPVWLELSNFISTVVANKSWAGFVSSNAPILLVGVPFLVVSVTSIPYLLGALGLNAIIRRIERGRKFHDLYGIGVGLIVGVVLGTLLMGIFYCAMNVGGQGPFDQLEDWIDYVIWVLWSGFLFSLIGWRMSLEHKKLSPTIQP
jgi:hypothetical protein